MINDLYIFVHPSNYLNIDLSIQPYNYSSTVQRQKKKYLLCHKTLVVITDTAMCNCTLLNICVSNEACKHLLEVIVKLVIKSATRNDIIS